MECQDHNKPVKAVATIVNEKGLHARASSKFASLANLYSATIEVEKNGVSVSGKSIMGLLLLSANKGSKITIKTCGPEKDLALEALVSLVEKGFDEV